MEGICGIIALQNREIDLKPRVQKMAEFLTDGEILDASCISGKGWALSAGGWQREGLKPVAFTMEDEHLKIAGVADLANIDELARQFGHASGDLGRIVVSLVKANPKHWAQQLRGSFAITVFDAKTGQFNAVIDRVGIRPLYWCVKNELFYFGSRLRTISSICPQLEIDYSMLYGYIHYSMIPSPLTIFKEVQKLEPGCLVKGQGGSVSKSRYWDMLADQKIPESEQHIAQNLYEVVSDSLASALKRQNQACFLSGGTDSSAICGLMSKSYSKPVQAISIGFPENGYDEMHYARIAAKAFNLDHHEYYMQPDDILADISKISAAYDEPFDNSSVFPAYYCAKIARANGANYMLAGDGGDEIFAGNERYGAQQIFRNYFKIPSLLRKQGLEPILLDRLEKLPVPLFRKAASYIRRANLSEVERIFSYRYVADEDMFAPEFLEMIDRFRVFNVRESHFNRLENAENLDRHLYMDMKLTITDNDLRKVTRMCELAGVRVEYPYLDQNVIELGFRIPTALKLKGSKGLRYIFKRAFSDLLPDEILKKEKHGFGLPISQWFRKEPKIKEFAGDVLFDPRHLTRGYYKSGFLDKIWRLQLQDQTPYYGTIIYQMLMLELWHREHHDRQDTLQTSPVFDKLAVM